MFSNLIAFTKKKKKKKKKKKNYSLFTEIRLDFGTAKSLHKNPVASKVSDSGTTSSQFSYKDFEGGGGFILKDLTPFK